MDRKYCLGLYEKAIPPELDWKEKLRAARESGFDFMEISIDETDEKLSRLAMTKKERHELVRTMAEESIPIRSMCLSGHRRYPFGSHDPEIREKSLKIMKIMKDAIHLADDLGIRIIQLAGYDVYYEDGDETTRKYFIKNLEKAVNEAAKYGIFLGFETMETEFMNTVKKSMKFVSNIDSPYLNVYPDVGNITNAAHKYGNNVSADMVYGRGHLIAVHLKETKPGIFRDMHFGEGYVDFESVIQTAWELGVRRYVTEFWYKGSLQWKNDLTDANAKMREILDRQK